MWVCIYVCMRVCVFACAAARKEWKEFPAPSCTGVRILKAGSTPLVVSVWLSKLGGRAATSFKQHPHSKRITRVYVFIGFMVMWNLFSLWAKQVTETGDKYYLCLCLCLFDCVCQWRWGCASACVMCMRNAHTHAATPTKTQSETQSNEHKDTQMFKIKPSLWNKWRGLTATGLVRMCESLCDGGGERDRLHSRCWKPPTVECVSFVSWFLSLSCLQRHRGNCTWFAGVLGPVDDTNTDTHTYKTLQINENYGKHITTRNAKLKKT